MKHLRFKRGTSPSVRFWSNVDVRMGDCWIWRGTYRGNRYGCFFVGRMPDGRNRHVSPQVFSWEEANGPLPAGAEIHHECRNPSCVHPLHLTMLTHEEHVLLHPRVTATHCVRGHPLSGANLFIIKSTGYRRCRACDALRHRPSWTRKWQRNAVEGT